MFQHNFLRIAIILVSLLAVGCSDTKQKQTIRNKKLQSWSRTLAALNDRLKSFEKEKEDAQRYIESAEVHQVTRSKEEKARQLLNLNLYKTEIGSRIDSTRALINNYKDSIQRQSE
jgi:outer membrane murein-binding lipoprotein Lpp